MVATHSHFVKMSIDEIEPKGWIVEFLSRQTDGLSGNIGVAGYPYNTCLWGCPKMKGSTKAWWPYEQTAYYLDGINRLGILTNNKGLLSEVKRNTDYIKANIDSTGRFGTNLQDRWWRWPYTSINRVFMTDYELTGNEELVHLLANHYGTFAAEDFCDDLELANVEQLCWLYGETADKKFIEMGEEAYACFKSDIENRNRLDSDIQFGANRKPDHHGVVYLELVKIPALLYKYTGNKAYLEESMNGITKMEKYHMLVSGLPSTTEHFADVSEVAGHETCNTAVLPHTYGYLMRITGESWFGDRIERAVFNAGIGSVTKDFKSHQYFSAPNQILATINSNPFGHHPTRMAFAPGHDVECCTGNVNRFMPYYIEQMWATSKDNGLVAALYGPSTISAKVGENNQPITVNQITNYPFSNNIRFEILMERQDQVNFPFSMRIPEWANNAKIIVNGTTIQNEITPGSFFRLKRDFKSGDIIELELPMEIRTTQWPNNGIAVERGPIVYSLALTEKKDTIHDYEKSTTSFPAFTMSPTSEWRYGLPKDNLDFELIQKEFDGYPWEVANTPLKIKVKGFKIRHWQLNNYFDERIDSEITTTPSFPKQVEVEENSETSLELIPYGTTTLRMTVFPVVSNE
ncbi:beta-L-arabinofuranosidase domain-containing protein [Allomuricauda sp. AC10]|nr:beta-L-arabinofuranosidase domain-containing protein [Muricauda sp. AC10]